MPFLFVLTVVVFVHEMGHYLVGRWCGIGVKAFSIGFGPELFGFNDRHGTRWKLSRDSARRLRQVRRRHECDEHAGRSEIEALTDDRTQGRLPHPAGLEARR